MRKFLYKNNILDLNGYFNSKGRYCDRCCIGYELQDRNRSRIKRVRCYQNVLPNRSKFSRLLQAADLVVGCTLAMVSGESQYPLPVFESVMKLFDQSAGRIGGYGLKIHPDFKYANLYHWIVEDTHFWKHASGYPLPVKQCPYYKGPFEQ